MEKLVIVNRLHQLDNSKGFLVKEKEIETSINFGDMYAYYIVDKDYKEEELKIISNKLDDCTSIKEALTDSKRFCESANEYEKLNKDMHVIFENGNEWTCQPMVDFETVKTITIFDEIIELKNYDFIISEETISLDTFNRNNHNSGRMAYHERIHKILSDTDSEGIMALTSYLDYQGSKQTLEQTFYNIDEVQEYLGECEWLSGEDVKRILGEILELVEKEMV